MKERKLLFIRKSAIYQKLKSKYLGVRPIFRYYLNWRTRDRLLGKDPIFIYNHIPKCGGTSFLVLLRDVFSLIQDYPPHELEYSSIEEFEKELAEFEFKIPSYSDLKPYQVLAGHFFSPRFSLSKRFHVVFQNQRVKLITFLRDPLTHRVSLFSFGQMKGHTYVKGYSLEEFILKENNNIASFLQCDYTNYKKRLEYYFFVGIMENYSKSIQVLSQRLNMKFYKEIPHINKSNSSQYSDFLSREIIQKFKKNNELDYLIYSYSIHLLNK